MNKKILFSIFGAIVLISFFAFSFGLYAANEVRIDNFNVVQRTIPSISSNVDFRLTISQQDQSLDCEPLVPYVNGSLKWRVWYETTGGSKTVVRERDVSLPLSPNPMNLDFQETVQPSQEAIQAGGMNFRTALGCKTYIVQQTLDLAVSAPIQVTISGGGQVPPGGGQVPGQPGQPVSFNFEIPNPITANSFIELVKGIYSFIFQISIPIAVVLIIWVGIMFLTSQGNEAKVKQAKQALLWIIVGLAIILIGQGFVTLIESILNLGTPSP